MTGTPENPGKPRKTQNFRKKRENPSGKPNTKSKKVVQTRVPPRENSKKSLFPEKWPDFRTFWTPSISGLLRSKKVTFWTKNHWFSPIFDEKYHVFDPIFPIWGMVYSELTIIFGPRSPVYKEGTPLEPRVLGHDSPHFIDFWPPKHPHFRPTFREIREPRRSKPGTIALRKTIQPKTYQLCAMQ